MAARTRKQLLEQIAKLEADLKRAQEDQAWYQRMFVNEQRAHGELSKKLRSTRDALRAVMIETFEAREEVMAAQFDEGVEFREHMRRVYEKLTGIATEERITLATDTTLFGTLAINAVIGVGAVALSLWMLGRKKKGSPEAAK